MVGMQNYFAYLRTKLIIPFHWREILRETAIAREKNILNIDFHRLLMMLIIFDKATQSQFMCKQKFV